MTRTVAGARRRLLSIERHERDSLDEVALLTVVVAAGDSSRGMSAPQLARRLLDRAGSLDALVRTPNPAERFDLGPTIGSRVAAMAELSIRLHRDPPMRGRFEVRGDNATIQERVLREPSRLSEAELIAVFLGQSYPDGEAGRRLLADAGGLARLMRLADDPPVLVAKLSEKLAARIVAVAELALRFQTGAGDHATRVAADLALAAVDFGARVLDAVSRGADRGVASRAASLLRRVHDLGGDVLLGEQATVPDLDAVHRALEGES